MYKVCCECKLEYISSQQNLRLKDEIETIYVFRDYNFALKGLSLYVVHGYNVRTSNLQAEMFHCAATMCIVWCSIKENSLATKPDSHRWE